MSIHSFLDGVALAAGLAVGGGLGLVIAVVVIIHRFSDGISVVSLLLASQTPIREAYRWVAIVAIAPVLGVLLGLVVTVPDEVLGVMLAVFAGFFLYVGAAELLPEAHRSDRSRWVVAGDPRRRRRDLRLLGLRPARSNDRAPPRASSRAASSSAAVGIPSRAPAPRDRERRGDHRHVAPPRRGRGPPRDPRPALR